MDIYAGRSGVSANRNALDGTTPYVVGVHHATLTSRAFVVRVEDGAACGSAVHEYHHGVMHERLAATGAPLPPDWAVQVPSDYVDVLRVVVPNAVAPSGVPADTVIGIGTDFTACTVLPTTDDGTPVCELDEYRDRPHAYDGLYAEYELLHDYFGQGGNDVMRRLKRIRREAVAS